MPRALIIQGWLCGTCLLLRAQIKCAKTEPTPQKDLCADPAHERKVKILTVLAHITLLLHALDL